MSQEIIIDGYNFIACVLDVFPDNDFSSRVNREYLLSMLASYAAVKNVQISLVFDNKTNISNYYGDRTWRGKIQIYYAQIGVSADDIITQLVSNHNNPKTLIIVSSDKRHVRKLTSGYGCNIKPANEFMRILMKQEKN